MELTEVAPEKLRPDVHAAVERLGAEDLAVLHRILLQLEKERLWRELSAEFEADARAGKYDQLDNLIREARAELRAR